MLIRYGTRKLHLRERLPKASGFILTATAEHLQKIYTSYYQELPRNKKIQNFMYEYKLMNHNK